eukprot:scaffold108950_cov32-Tisochrysis_lutea.AAC.5
MRPERRLRKDVDRLDDGSEDGREDGDITYGARPEHEPHAPMRVGRDSALLADARGKTSTARAKRVHRPGSESGNREAIFVMKAHGKTTADTTKTVESVGAPFSQASAGTCTHKPSER